MGKCGSAYPVKCANWWRSREANPESLALDANVFTEVSRFYATGKPGNNRCGVFSLTTPPKECAGEYAKAEFLLEKRDLNPQLLAYKASVLPDWTTFDETALFRHRHFKIILGNNRGRDTKRSTN